MKNIRELLLKTLAVTRLATISSLATQLEINPITVRNHLQSMEQDGLIMSSERRHGVGRPHVVYQLTNTGQEEVASKYRFLAENLIATIKQHFGSQGLTETLETIGQEMASAHYLESNPTLSEWMDSFCDLLAEQGYQVDWEMKNKRVYIHNASCPYHHLKQTYPEICSLDRSLFSHLLATDLHFENALSAKGSACIYSYEVIND